MVLPVGIGDKGLFQNDFNDIGLESWEWNAESGELRVDNDFVGELAYLEELEHSYQLTKGIRANQPEKLLELTKKWVELKSLNDDWKKRQKNMLEQTISVTPFWVGFFKEVAS